MLNPSILLCVLAVISACMLRVEKANKFGTPLYVEDHEEGSIVQLDNGDFWYIRDPSDDCTSHLFTNFDCKEHCFNGKRFILSQRASEVVSSPGGSACVVEFSHQGEGYFLMVLDNKDYLQSCQGGKDETDQSYEETMQRELKEELDLDVAQNELNLIGSRSFASYNPLIDYTIEMTNYCYHLVAQYDRIAHLIPNDVFFPIDKVTLIPTDSIQTDLHEIQHVAVIPMSSLEMAEKHFEVFRKHKSKFERVGFSGHHREVLRRRLGLPNGPALPYLHTFDINF